MLNTIYDLISFNLHIIGVELFIRNSEKLNLITRKFCKNYEEKIRTIFRYINWEFQLDFLRYATFFFREYDFSNACQCQDRWQKVSFLVLVIVTRLLTIFTKNYELQWHPLKSTQYTRAQKSHCTKLVVMGYAI